MAYGATITPIRGFRTPEGLACRACAQKREDKGEIRLFTSDVQPFYQEYLDKSAFFDGGYWCRFCEKWIRRTDS